MEAAQAVLTRVRGKCKYIRCRILRIARWGRTGFDRIGAIKMEPAADVYRTRRGKQRKQKDAKSNLVVMSKNAINRVKAFVAPEAVQFALAA